MSAINQYLLQRPKLLLTLMWIFVAAAVIPGVLLNLLMPQMPLLPFFAIIGVPALIALYLRLLYSKIQERNRAEREQRRQEENNRRYQHKKKR